MWTSESEGGSSAVSEGASERYPVDEGSAFRLVVLVWGHLFVGDLEMTADDAYSG